MPLVAVEPETGTSNQMTGRLHAGAWWVWALCLAVAASRTTNPIVLALIIAIAAYVVAARRPATPWGRSFGYFLKLGLVIIIIRTVFAMLFGGAGGSSVLWTWPVVPLPGWLSGITLGGPVTAQALLGGLADGMRLAAILACVGAANSLASPTRLLKSVPAALYEIGVAIVVAITFAPQLITDVQRLRAARRLRGRPHRGLRGIAGVALPVVEGALVRSITLAAAMDSRGYGRQAHRSPAARRLSAGLLLLGLTAGVIGIYGFLDAAAPVGLGLPLIVVGLLASLGAIAMAGRGSVRTRYRPDSWGLREWLVVASSGIPAIVATVAAAGSNLAMTPNWEPLALPGVPIVVVMSLTLALAPAWIAPPSQTISTKQDDNAGKLAAAPEFVAAPKPSVAQR